MLSLTPGPSGLQQHTLVLQYTAQNLCGKFGNSLKYKCFRCHIQTCHSFQKPYASLLPFAAFCFILNCLKGFSIDIDLFSIFTLLSFCLSAETSGHILSVHADLLGKEFIYSLVHSFMCSPVQSTILALF